MDEQAILDGARAAGQMSALYRSLGSIVGLNIECPKHKSYPWQLHCEICRHGVTKELYRLGVRATEPEESRVMLERVAEVEEGYRHLERRIRELRDALVPIADMDLESGITPEQVETLRQHIERARDAVITF